MAAGVNRILLAIASYKKIMGYQTQELSKRGTYSCAVNDSLADT